MGLKCPEKCADLCRTLSSSSHFQGLDMADVLGDLFSLIAFGRGRLHFRIACAIVRRTKMFSDLALFTSCRLFKPAGMSVEALSRKRLTSVAMRPFGIQFKCTLIFL
jgi:hypothetical protein